MTPGLMECGWCGRPADTLKRPWAHRYESTEKHVVLVCEVESFELVCGHMATLENEMKMGNPTKIWCVKCNAWQISVAATLMGYTA